MASTLPETKERSLARFNQKWRADGECWAWTGALTNGYGSFRINGRSYGAHQAAFLLLKGALPTCIDHLCRNRACVNPAHLEAVSNRENVLRGVGVTAINAKKTHCPKGHELTVDNTLIKTSNRHDYRACRTCYNEYERGRKTRAAAKRRMNMLTETERKRQDELARLKAQLRAAERERDSLREALTTIRDRSGCMCDHSDSDCCAKVGFECDGCFAALTLAALKAGKDGQQ